MEEEELAVDKHLVNLLYCQEKLKEAEVLGDMLLERVLLHNSWYDILEEGTNNEDKYRSLLNDNKIEIDMIWTMCNVLGIEYEYKYDPESMKKARTYYRYERILINRKEIFNDKEVK